jgi:hypothetical protein
MRVWKSDGSWGQGVYITANGTGTGSTGTYILSHNLGTVASGSVNIAVRPVYGPRIRLYNTSGSSNAGDPTGALEFYDYNDSMKAYISAFYPGASYGAASSAIEFAVANNTATGALPVMHLYPDGLDIDGDLTVRGGITTDQSGAVYLDYANGANFTYVRVLNANVQMYSSNASFYSDWNQHPAFTEFTLNGTGNYFTIWTDNATYTFNETSLTLSSADILMGNTLGDRVTLYGTHDASNSYALGIESNTLYYRANGVHRWYINAVADGGTSDIMQLDATGLVINGSLVATTKSFDIEHPTNENMRLRYGSLEGPENGVYVRGKTSSTTITLPEYWTGLVDPDSITVQLTPTGKYRKLYVEDISDNTVTVGGARGRTEFFYFIQAERKDVEKLVVEYGS